MSELKLGVFSGECLLGVCGVETNLKTVNCEPLFVGDIVCICKENYLPDYFTVVAQEGFTTYQGGKIVQVVGGKHFIMGIKDSNETLWNPIRMKSYKDCIEGERWPEHGFNYRMFDASKIDKTTNALK